MMGFYADPSNGIGICVGFDYDDQNPYEFRWFCDNDDQHLYDFVCFFTRIIRVPMILYGF